MSGLAGESILEELETLGEVWNHTFSFISSMSFKCALELGVPDAIHAHGGAITLPQLAAALSIPPAKLTSLRRLMRMLVHTGCFANRTAAEGGGARGLADDDAYLLTPVSRLLVSSKQTAASPFVQGMLHQILLHPWHSLSAWFHSGEATPFAAAHGKGIFEVAHEQPDFAGKFIAAMESDSRLVGKVLIKEHSKVFEGVRSMVDVGGCLGSLATSIAEAFLDMKCTVLDLPHVVAAATANERTSEKLDFIGGDMFEHIPSADLLILKWVLHDWNDADCVKILKRCKEAIPSKENGGKVIIIEIVLKAGHEASLPQLSFDMLMMAVSGGMQREEREWHQIFIEAGYSGYKITPLGVRSLIELYP